MHVRYATGNSADSSEVAVVTANCTGLEFNLQSCYGHAIDRLGNCSSGQRVCLLCEGEPIKWRKQYLMAGLHRENGGRGRNVTFQIVGGGGAVV